MKAWGRLLFVTCVGAALVVMPQAATAKPGYYVSKPSRFEMVHLKSSNGYAIDLISFGGKYLALLANRFDGSASQSASYIIRGHALTLDEIHASLGKFGRVALRFRPSGPPKVQHEAGRECKGRDSTEQKGHFVGSFRFRGERGFTSVRASSANGQVFRSFKKVCKRPHEPSGGGTESKAVSLGAYVKGDPDKAAFGAYELAPTSSFGSENVDYTASAGERRGRMTITHSANAFAEASTFAVSNPSVSPTTASVAPPFPFAGTATLERNPSGASSWSGNLSADLPGLGTVPLTGPSFTARLCRDLSCACPPKTPCAFLVFGERRLQQARLLRRDTSAW
jgi:hypothetical protein